LRNCAATFPALCKQRDERGFARKYAKATAKRMQLNYKTAANDSAPRQTLPMIANLQLAISGNNGAGSCSSERKVCRASGKRSFASR
jgi:hypothetical protein